MLDEADIFLEARNDYDVTRNALVGIFLRLLEYHQGVMFLTTNRISSFDSAFNSRISVALKYRKLDEKARSKVWKNFLNAASITGIDAVELGKFELNGRQIRNGIQLAQALAASEDVPPTLEHFKKTLPLLTEFELEHGKDKKSVDEQKIEEDEEEVKVETFDLGSK